MQFKLNLRNFYEIFFGLLTGVGPRYKLVQKFGRQLRLECATLRNQLVLAGPPVKRQIPFQRRLQPEHYRHSGLKRNIFEVIKQAYDVRK